MVIAAAGGDRMQPPDALEDNPGVAPILEFEHLSFPYGAAGDVGRPSLRIVPGELKVPHGANGAGKSSTLNAIVELGPSSKGRVMFPHRDIGHLPTEVIIRGDIALVPEGQRLCASLAMAEDLFLGSEPQRQS